MMSKEITLRDIAGYATERTIWQLLLNLSEQYSNVNLNTVSPDAIIIEDNSFKIGSGRYSDAIKSFCPPEFFIAAADINSDTAAVWTIGALAFYAIMGVELFEGKGGVSQTEKTEIPRISTAHVSQVLGSLVFRCLSYTPSERPSIADIRQMAKKSVTESVLPGKKISNQSGNSYSRSLIKFWPEEMVQVIIMSVLLFLFPNITFGQNELLANIPDEMNSLVQRCVDLRSSDNTAKVSKAMERDLKWTMMDELPIDRNGECTINDEVDTFGLNEIGFEILKRHNGITNAGGRFRDGRDPRYRYSFIEITVKKGVDVNYEISGREGPQLIAIVPFDQEAVYSATIPEGKSFVKDGICYIRLEHKLLKTDKFNLLISNKSDNNNAFVIINYNSRDSE